MMKSTKQNRAFLIIERRLEKEIKRNFQPAFMTKWKKSDYNIKLGSFNFSGNSYQGISNHEVFIGLEGFATYIYGLNHCGKDSKTLLHRLGGPACFAVNYKANKVERVYYYLLNQKLSSVNYWIRLAAIAPRIYKTKLIGSKLYVQAVSNKIPCPTFIELGDKPKCCYQIENMKVSEDKFWTYWEQLFTILDDHSKYYTEV
jgi:hypothetical protein